MAREVCPVRDVLIVFPLSIYYQQLVLTEKKTSLVFSTNKKLEKSTELENPLDLYNFH